MEVDNKNYHQCNYSFQAQQEPDDQSVGEHRDGGARGQAPRQPLPDAQARQTPRRLQRQLQMRQTHYNILQVESRIFWNNLYLKFFIWYADIKCTSIFTIDKWYVIHISQIRLNCAPFKFFPQLHWSETKSIFRPLYTQYLATVTFFPRTIFCSEKYI